jgi:hypothetical protein
VDKQHTRLPRKPEAYGGKSDGGSSQGSFVTRQLVIFRAHRVGEREAVTMACPRLESFDTRNVKVHHRNRLSLWWMIIWGRTNRCAQTSDNY